MGKTKLVAVSLVTGCFTGGPPVSSVTPPAQGQVPTVEVATAHDHTVEIWQVSGAGIKLERTVVAPLAIGDLQWRGADPVVQLAAELEPDGSVGERDGEIGRITHDGYQPTAAMPAATWAVEAKPQSDPSLEEISPPSWGLVVTADGSIYQARCQWGYHGDEGGCFDWMYARVAPTAGPADKTAPQTPPELPMPAIAPSTRTKVEIVKGVAPEGHPDSGDFMVVHCTAGGAATVEFPGEDTRNSSSGVTRVTWLATEPPMFAVTETVDGLDAYDQDTVFEGCAPSPTFKEARSKVGPGELVATYTAEVLTMRWHGRELGKLANTRFVAFAPK